MRIINAFFLALFVYSAILFFFLYFILYRPKPKPPVVVYVHQAIAFEKKKIDIQKKPQKQIVESQKKQIEKKEIIKTKDKFSKGGEDIKFDDIFSNVSENVKTTKLKQKKQKNMAKERGNSIAKEVKKQLQNLKTTFSISNISGSNNDAEFIQNEFSKVWSKIDTNPGDFIKIDINIQNGIINVVVIATNLDTIRLKQFLNDIKFIDTSKINNFKAVINFKSKLKD